MRIELLAELTKVTLIEACKISVTGEEMLKGVRLLEAQLQQSNLLLLLLSQLAESLLELRDSVTIERDESLTLLLLTLSLLLLREEALALLFLERETTASLSLTLHSQIVFSALPQALLLLTKDLVESATLSLGALAGECVRIGLTAHAVENVSLELGSSVEAEGYGAHVWRGTLVHLDKVLLNEAGRLPVLRLEEEAQIGDGERGRTRLASSAMNVDAVSLFEEAIKLNSGVKERVCVIFRGSEVIDRSAKVLHAVLAEPRAHLLLINAALSDLFV